MRVPQCWHGIRNGAGKTTTMRILATQLQQAKLGVLSTVLAAPVLTWLVFRAAGLLPARLQVRAARPSPSSGKCPPATATSGTCGATSR
jgi:hypothetical protein